MKSKYSTYNDRELVGLLRKSNGSGEQAFAELYHRYSSQVNAYCMRVLNDQEAAEDVFQETFIRFYNNVSGDFKELNVPGFLITIARNLCLNYKRNRKNGVEIEDVDVLVYQENYEKKELLELINRSLEVIDDDLREAFVLKEYSGFQYNEIAEMLNITVVNAKTRVFRAKQKIKTVLQPYLKDLA